MVERVLAALAIVTAIWLGAYVMVAFATWSWDPGDWDPVGRGFVAIICGGLTVGVVGTCLEGQL